MPAHHPRRWMRPPFLLASVLTLALSACAGRVETGAVFHEIPSSVRADTRYAIYLHGRIVEEQGVRPTDPRFGVYGYEDILAALAEGGLQVISEVRRPNTDPVEYAHALADQVRGVIRAGAPPGHITVVGMSEGGGIAILTSGLLQNDQLRFVLLASCGGDVLNDQSLTIAGRVLSIYEASDEMGILCQPLFSRSSRSSVFREIRLETGLAHGEFYIPRAEWLDPTVKWALGEE